MRPCFRAVAHLSGSPVRRSRPGKRGVEHLRRPAAVLSADADADVRVTRAITSNGGADWLHHYFARPRSRGVPDHTTLSRRADAGHSSSAARSDPRSQSKVLASARRAQWLVRSRPMLPSANTPRWCQPSWSWPRLEIKKPNLVFRVRLGQGCYFSDGTHGLIRRAVREALLPG